MSSSSSRQRSIEVVALALCCLYLAVGACWFCACIDAVRFASSFLQWSIHSTYLARTEAMQPVLRSTWNGLAASFRNPTCVCRTRFCVSSASYRRLQSRLYHPNHPAMELVRPVKKQHTAAFVADADSPAVLSEDTNESVQDPAVAVSTANAESPARYSTASAALFMVLLGLSGCLVGGPENIHVSMTTLHNVHIVYRNAKILPVPRLIQPGSLPHESDLWDCSALLVDKPKTWTSFDVCGKLKGVLRVKKVSCCLLQLLLLHIDLIFSTLHDCCKTKLWELNAALYNRLYSLKSRGLRQSTADPVVNSLTYKLR